MTLDWARLRNRGS